eukprot:1159450-Pelagomonas_calceolata.AAC.2
MGVCVNSILEGGPGQEWALKGREGMREGAKLFDQSRETDGVEKAKNSKQWKEDIMGFTLKGGWWRSGGSSIWLQNLDVYFS